MTMKKENEEDAPLLTKLPEQYVKPQRHKIAPIGRKPGSKNKLTLLREAVLTKQEHVILKELPKIVEVVCKKAVEGDLTAAKLILERIIPVKKQTDDNEGNKGPPVVNIVIEGSKTKVKFETKSTEETFQHAPLEEDALEGDFEEIDEEDE